MYNKFDLYMNHMRRIHTMICRFELAPFYHDSIYHIAINVIIDNKCK